MTHATMVVLCAWSLASAGAGAADTASHTAAGVAYTVPDQWTQREAGDVVLLSPPEPDLQVAIVRIAGAEDAALAAVQAWRQFTGHSMPPVRLVSPRPPRDGWAERADIDYEPPPVAHRGVGVRAHRVGSSWTVLLIDGDAGTLEKRSAAIDLIQESIRAPGYVPETLSGRRAHRLDDARLQALLQFVRSSAEALHVPGVGLALIDHGRIVFEGGVGVRDIHARSPVDAHTLFMIASNTKGMSTLLLARLADAGKLRWDQPVTQLYPAFRLGSEATTRQVLMRHLVCACTGLPRKDYEWIFRTTSATPASDTFTQLAATEPTSGFGEVYQYNNLMASAAGYIGGHLIHPERELGAAYDAAMQEWIFDPLGMHDTTLSMARALAGNRARPHDDDLQGQVQRVDDHFNDTVIPYRPAGGAWSSAHDMIRYVRNELSQGRLPNGKQWVSTQNLLKRRARGVPDGENAWYGMGLEEDASSGVSVIHHGGSMWGFKSDFFVIPDAQVGAVVLTNSESGYYLHTAFGRRLLEVLYDGEARAVADVQANAAAIAADRAALRKRLVVPADPQVVSRLAGVYESPDLGTLEVLREPGAVRVRVPAWTGEVASRVNDDGTVSLLTIDPANWGFEFVLSEQDGRRALKVLDNQHTYTYLERPAGL